ncbi:hypothetical protein B0I35DRAFT_439284 [Stachybotrys elegans]|uniref:Uncharacterized protein n=1 Tax=Stachybotrys elegans TaxID=80388 RepID=A0A8K0SKV3_9HYPO|nr:hypothetical protein B0I35DRAFT_439284 [Stachybotrys elegans]
MLVGRCLSGRCQPPQSCATAFLTAPSMDFLTALEVLNSAPPWPSTSSICKPRLAVSIAQHHWSCCSILFHPLHSLHSSTEMDSTPLLSAIGGLPGPNTMQDHPAFLRASHSPWRCIPQNVLVVLRGIILAYLMATAVTGTDYKLSLESGYTNWRYLFDFSVVSFLFVLVYHAITFSWTFTHLYYPHAENVGGVEGYILWAMSLPSNMGSLRKQFYFTFFYTTTTVFAFMNSALYWFVTRQNNEPGVIEPPPAPPSVSGAPGEGGEIWGWGTDTMHMPIPPGAPFSDLFGEEWFAAFNITNMYAITSLIMVFEILFLNSIKRPYSIGGHLFGLMFLSGMYLGWAGIGRATTGWYAFEWLDTSVVGSQEAVTAYCIGFVVLSPLMYTLMQGFIGIREGLTWSLSESRAAAAAQEALED